MGFGLGGKADTKVVLSSGYKKKNISSPGAFLSSSGLLHSFLIGDSVLETIWLNLFTRLNITSIEHWRDGLGSAPWENIV